VIRCDLALINQHRKKKEKKRKKKKRKKKKEKEKEHSPILWALRPGVHQCDRQDEEEYPAGSRRAKIRVQKG